MELLLYNFLQRLCFKLKCPRNYYLQLIDCHLTCNELQIRATKPSTNVSKWPTETPSTRRNVCPSAWLFEQLDGQWIDWQMAWFLFVHCSYRCVEDHVMLVFLLQLLRFQQYLRNLNLPIHLNHKFISEIDITHKQQHNRPPTIYGEPITFYRGKPSNIGFGVFGWKSYLQGCA